jgi:hypothetical protein
VDDKSFHWNPVWESYTLIDISTCGLVISGFLVICVLFPEACWRNHRAAWNDYKWYFVLQCGGIMLLLATLLTTDIMTFALRELKQYPLMTDEYLIANIC